MLYCSSAYGVISFNCNFPAELVSSIDWRLCEVIFFLLFGWEVGGESSMCQIKMGYMDVRAE